MARTSPFCDQNATQRRWHTSLFPQAMSQAAVLARTVGECCEGQIPRPLRRCKLDTPLLAAGSLI